MRQAEDEHAKGRLGARPRGEPPKTEVVREAGELPLGLSAGGRDATLYVPASYAPANPAPLLVLLHGAGGNAQHALAPFRSVAERCGVLLLAPESRSPRTWDVIEQDALGPDVAFIDHALGFVFERYAIDAARIAIGGFSDGASYALTLGLPNGDLFGAVLAYSPGFSAAPNVVGGPRIFVAHGTRDEVLPIDRCSRRLVPLLRRAGLAVDYHEFDGPHTVPAPLVQLAFDQTFCNTTAP